MEQWTRWEPIQGLEGKYYLDYFGWLRKGFIIELINFKCAKKIQILFYFHVDSYRYTNESFCFKVFGDLSDQYGDDFYADWSFFKVTNSEYLAWLSEKSCTWSDQFPFIHFCIFGGDKVVDVIARYEPKVTFMEYKPEAKIIEYTRQEFGLALKEKIQKREIIEDIMAWIFDIYCEHIHDVDDEFQNFLEDLNNMKLKLSYEELEKIADRLIAGENVKLYP